MEKIIDTTKVEVKIITKGNKTYYQLRGWNSCPAWSDPEEIEGTIDEITKHFYDLYGKMEVAELPMGVFTNE